MKYYKLDSVEKEFHNQLLVNTLKPFLDPKHLGSQTEEQYQATMKDYGPNGTGRIFRSSALSVGTVCIWAIREIHGVSAWWEEIFDAFANIDLESDEFDATLNAIIDRAVGKLNQVRHDEYKVLQTISELEELRTFVGTTANEYRHSVRKRSLESQLDKWYEAKQLDKKFVEKLTHPIFDAETPEPFIRNIRTLVNYLTTPMN